MSDDDIITVVRTRYYHAYRPVDHPRRLLIRMEPDATDADPDRRPEEFSPQPDPEGRVDFFVDPNRPKRSHWKRKLGETVGSSAIREDFDRLVGGDWPRFDEAAVLEFPTNYRLYVHKSGDRHVPRDDAYLFGSHYVHYFRSPEEFAPHLMWIMRGNAMKDDGKPDCHCKYCDPSRTQTEISRALYHRKDGGGDRKGGGKRKDGEKRGKKSQFPSEIPFKDYTKLNKGTS